MAAAILTLARLLELLEYFPDTGLFIWRVKRRRANIGDVAGSISRTGYIRICIDHRHYMAHRLAWLYMTSAWPTQYIDHRDTDRSNNRFDNLREATNAQNRQNYRKAPIHNRQSGLLGVHRNGKRWRATIRADGQDMHLGYFDTPEVAHAAYVAAKRRIHPFGTL